MDMFIVQINRERERQWLRWREREEEREIKRRRELNKRELLCDIILTLVLPNNYPPSLSLSLTLSFRKYSFIAFYPSPSLYPLPLFLSLSLSLSLSHSKATEKYKISERLGPIRWFSRPKYANSGTKRGYSTPDRLFTTIVNKWYL